MFLHYDPLVAHIVLSTIQVLNLDVACITVDVLHCQWIPEDISSIHNDNTSCTTLSSLDDDTCVDVIVTSEGANNVEDNVLNDNDDDSDNNNYEDARDGNKSNTE